MRVIVGMQPVREAIAAHGPKLEKVLVEDKRDAPRLDALARFAESRGAKVERAPRREIDKLSRGVHHQGALAIAPALELVSIEALAALEDKGPIVALDEIEDPQNFGAIIRSAVAFGARGIVFPEHHAAPLSMATFRSSAGAIEHARLCRVPSLTRALYALAERGSQIVGLDMQGKDIDHAPLEPPLVIVIGAEGKGLRKGVRSVCSLLVRVPIQGPVASLNASVAAAIALYAVARVSG